MSEISKAYEPQSVEDKWYKFWLDEKCFVANEKSAKPAYSIVIPPPNVTGMLHMGHVLNNTIQDILSRKARMDGKEVLWLPGTDHAGIATQVMVEKQLKKEEKKSRHDLGREEFLKRVWVWKEKHGDIIINQLKKLGCSCDWTRERFTMDPEYSRCVQKVFVELYKKGLIYRGKRMVNWCPVSQTALSDEEVEMKPQRGFMYHFRVEAVEADGSPVKVAATPPSQSKVVATPSSPKPAAETASEGARATSGDEGVAATKINGPEIDSQGRIWLTIATTRPETIPGDTAVAVNPKDPRYAHLIGKHIVRPLPAELPREQKLIPIIGDEHVDFEFGTGVLKVTPAHDKADFDIGARHKLPLIEVINADGTMNALAGGPLAGLDRFKARKVAVEILTEQGVMIEAKPYENNVGFSQRADVPIEPRLSEQWFLKYPAVPESKACVAEGRMKFHPDRWAKVYDHWLTNIQDWCISRQLWWGHRIPVWRRKFEKTVLLRSPSLGEVLLPSENVAMFVSSKQFRANFGTELIEKKAPVRVLDKGVVTSPKSVNPEAVKPSNADVRYWWRVVREDDDTIEIEAVTGCDEVGDYLSQYGFTQDPDVLDTWFSSWLWPFATMGWPEQTETLKKFYPTTDLVTGPDIIFFWVARMIMAGYEYMGDMPFQNVYFTGIIRDKQGRKMSKTLGNSPDPLVLIAQYGADALRFGTMRSAPLGQDVLFDEKDVELGRNFCNKLWNACRFRQMQGGGDASSPNRAEGGAATFETEAEINPALLTSDDKWILLRLDQAIKEVSEALTTYNFATAVQALYRFFWSEYCDWYVEASKAAFFGTDAALKTNKLAVIDFVLGNTIRLFHPFLPFITEELWHGMGYSKELPENQGGKTIMFAAWPKPFSAEELEYFTLDDTADKIAAAKYELVGLGRNLRREMKLDPAKKLKFVLKPAGNLAAAEVEVLKILLNAEVVEVVAKDWSPAKGTPSAGNALGEIFLPLEGLIDIGAEKIRLTKEAEKIQSEIVKVEEKLANPNFAQKVPAKVLDEHKQRLADWQAKLAQVKASLAALN
jgi:valyl-tRNA synthetase